MDTQSEAQSWREVALVFVTGRRCRMARNVKTVDCVRTSPERNRNVPGRKKRSAFREQQPAGAAKARGSRVERVGSRSISSTRHEPDSVAYKPFSVRHFDSQHQRRPRPRNRSTTDAQPSLRH